MKKILTIAAISFSILNAPASAGFVDESENPIGIPVDKSRVSVVGTPEKRSNANGFGKDIPLMESMSQIVPRNYSFRTFGIGPDIAVSWQGGRDWLEVLADATAKIDGLLIEVDQEKRFVTLRKPGGVQETPKNTVGQTPWIVKDGDSVKGVLREWGERAGWDVVWDYEGDLHAKAGLSMQGDFKYAVRELFAAFPISIKIRAELRQDNTPPLLYITRDEGARQ